MNFVKIALKELKCANNVRIIMFCLAMIAWINAKLNTSTMVENANHAQNIVFNALNLNVINVKKAIELKMESAY